MAGVMWWYGVSHVMIVILFEVKVSEQFVQNLRPACHSTDTCGTAQLSCDAGQRLAILDVRHAHHVNVTKFDVCSVQVLNCSQVNTDCCLVGTTPDPDCFESYDQTILVDVHRNCSGATTSSSGGNFTCDVQLPPQPQTASGSCAKDSHQSVSSYSLVDYACVNDADISSLCVASEKTGSLLYTLWTPDSLPTLENGQTNITCRCRVASLAASSVSAFVRTLDVRLPKPGSGFNCSSVDVVDSKTTHFQTPCGEKGVFLFDPGFTQNDRIEPTTPFDVIFSLHVQNVPEMVWLGFAGRDKENLKLTCYGPNENIGLLEPPGNTESVADGNDGGYTSSDRAALIGGIVGGVVVIVIITFLCLHFYSKRNKDTTDSDTSDRNTSERKKDDWWERTREEDRIAELSQLGPASAVVIDDRRNMGYGKHRPTRVRYRYTPSELNAPIVVVAGSALPRTPGVQITELNDEDDTNNTDGASRGTTAASSSTETRHQRNVTDGNNEQAPQPHHSHDITGNGRYMNTSTILGSESNDVRSNEGHVNASTDDSGDERYVNNPTALTNSNQCSVSGDTLYANDLSTNQSSNMYTNDPHMDQPSSVNQPVAFVIVQEGHDQPRNLGHTDAATDVSHNVTENEHHTNVAPNVQQQTQEPQRHNETEEREMEAERQEALAAIRSARERKEKETAHTQQAYVTSVQVGRAHGVDKRRPRDKVTAGKQPTFITSVQVHRERDPDEPRVSYIKLDDTDGKRSSTDHWF